MRACVCVCVCVICVGGSKREEVNLIPIFLAYVTKWIMTSLTEGTEMKESLPLENCISNHINK